MFLGLIGGFDTVKEVKASQELDTIFPKAAKLEKRLKVMTKKASEAPYERKQIRSEMKIKQKNFGHVKQCQC